MNIFVIDNSLLYIGKVSTDHIKQFDHSYDWVHILESYKRYVGKDAVVLDIGSSSWIKSRQLSQYCRKLIGLELFTERMLKNFGNVEFKQGDWQNLSSYFCENSIDVIITSHVIEHVKDDVKALNEAFSVLKKGGILLISTPNRNRIAQLLIQLIKGKRKFPFWEHEREYVKKDLLSLIKRSSFKNSQYAIKGLVFGLHGGLIWAYLKKFPKFLEPFCGFWELIILK